MKNKERKVIETLGNSFYFYKLKNNENLISNFVLPKAYLDKKLEFKKIMKSNLIKLLSCKKNDCLFYFLVDERKYNSLKAKVQPNYSIGDFTFGIIDDNLKNYIFISKDKRAFILRLISLKSRANYNSKEITAFLHGAAVKSKNTSLMIGDRHSGKSSLCYYLMEDGHYIVGDDKVVITRNKNHFYVDSPFNLLKLRARVPIDKKYKPIKLGGLRYLGINKVKGFNQINKIYVLKRTRKKTKLSDITFEEFKRVFEMHVFSLNKGHLKYLDEFFIQLFKKGNIKKLNINWNEKGIITKLKGIIKG